MSPICRAPLLSAILLLAIVLPLRAGGDFLGKKAADWLKELADPKPTVRRGAAFALGKCGAAAAVPDLVRALADAEPTVREAAAYAIGEIAAERKDPALWERAGGPLRKMLAEEKDAKARRSAACAIGQFGPDAAPARDDLEQAFDSKDAAVRQNAAWALGRLKEKAGASGAGRLARALRDEDATVRRDAAAALGEVGRPTASPAVRALVDCLAHEKASEVRSVAVGSLVALIGPEDKEVAADLRDLLKEEDRELRRGAALALAKIGGAEAKAAVPVLVDGLHDGDATARELSANALAHVGEAAAEAVPELGKALSDPSEAVRRNAALALACVGSRAGEAVRPLLRALDVKESDKVREYASEAISHSEDGVNKVVPELLALLKDDPGQHVRQHVVMGLRWVSDFETSGTAGALEKVLSETGNAGKVVRYDAARVLAFRLHDKAPAKAVSVLEAMLNDTDLHVYKGTDPTLNKGNEAVKSGTGAKVNLGDDARYMAAQALAEIAGPGKREDALKVLRKAAESTDPIQKKVADDALKELGKR